MQPRPPQTFQPAGDKLVSLTAGLSDAICTREGLHMQGEWWLKVNEVNYRRICLLQCFAPNTSRDALHSATRVRSYRIALLLSPQSKK